VFPMIRTAGSRGRTGSYLGRLPSAEIRRECKLDCIWHNRRQIVGAALLEMASDDRQEATGEGDLGQVRRLRAGGSFGPAGCEEAGDVGNQAVVAGLTLGAIFKRGDRQFGCLRRVFSGEAKLLIDRGNHPLAPWGGSEAGVLSPSPQAGKGRLESLLEGLGGLEEIDHLEASEGGSER
jgi:hypothetical protein